MGNYEIYQTIVEEAVRQAKKSLSEGGIPIGSVLADGNRIVSVGHNQRVQTGNPLAHGEMDCIAHAGRQKTYKNFSLYTTLSPCMMGLNVV